MTCYDFCNVRHTGKTEFHSVSIENFGKGVLRGKTVVQNLEKGFSNLGFDSFTKWGVEPEYFFFSYFSSFAAQGGLWEVYILIGDYIQPFLKPPGRGVLHFHSLS